MSEVPERILHTRIVVEPYDPSHPEECGPGNRDTVCSVCGCCEHCFHDCHCTYCSCSQYSPQEPTLRRFLDVTTRGEPPS